MGNSQHCAFTELLSNCGLDQIVRVVIDGRRGFVQDQDLCLSEQGSSQADELSLANAQVIAALAALKLQLLLQAGDELLQVRQLQRSPYFLVSVDLERVEIHADCSRKYHWVLRNNGELVSQVVQAYLVYVDIIDHDITSRELHHSE